MRNAGAPVRGCVNLSGNGIWRVATQSRQSSNAHSLATGKNYLRLQVFCQPKRGMRLSETRTRFKPLALLTSEPKDTAHTRLSVFLSPSQPRPACASCSAMNCPASLSPLSIPVLSRIGLAEEEAVQSEQVIRSHGDAGC